jgi:hypothetical protein
MDPTNPHESPIFCWDTEKNSTFSAGCDAIMKHLPAIIYTSVSAFYSFSSCSLAVCSVVIVFVLRAQKRLFRFYSSNYFLR